MLQTSSRPAPRLTPGLRQSIALLPLALPTLLARLALAAAENPALRLVPPGDGGGPAGQRPLFDADSLAAPAEGLIAHVLRQIDRLNLAPRERVLALVLVEALEPTGWLGRDPARLARECGVPAAQLETILHRLQRLDPAGLFACSLAECLRLQAEDAGIADPAMLAVLDHLPLLAKGDLAALAAATGHAPEDIDRAARRIRGLNPKPGLALGGPLPPALPPDLVAHRDANGWRAAPHPALPRIEIRTGAGDPRQARLWQDAVQRRAAMGQRIAGLILSHQGAALDGSGPLRALTSSELASATGLHLSTVNRILTGTVLATPQGTFPLRQFLSRPLPQNGAPAAQAMRALAALLDRPGQPRPPDGRLAELLAAQGYPLARRTVAKYRRALAKTRDC